MNIAKVDLNLLVYLDVLLREGSVTRAANQLSITQPAMSNGLKRLRDLFKDEVREVGKELGLPDFILGRHPFPGPGLAVRIIGDITKERISILQEADQIFIEILKEKNEYDFKIFFSKKNVSIFSVYQILKFCQNVTEIGCGPWASAGSLPDSRNNRFRLLYVFYSFSALRKSF